MNITTVLLPSASLSPIFNGTPQLIFSASSLSQSIYINTAVFKTEYVSQPYNIPYDATLNLYISGSVGEDFICSITSPYINLNTNYILTIPINYQLNNSALYIKYTGSLAPTQGNTNLYVDIYYDTINLYDRDPIFTFDKKGQFTEALEQGSAVTGSGRYSHAQGVGTYARASGSHAEGQNTVAQGNYSHAEGLTSVASGSHSHAEGANTIAIGNSSHTEGRATRAIGLYSHAEGDTTVAFGDSSHASGQGTIASGSNQTAVGVYNRHNNTTDLFVIGNGVSDVSRSDIVNISSTAVRITGSLNVSGSITGSLFGTSSWSVSSSQALTASFLLPGTYNITSSWATNAQTASFLPVGTYNITASWAQSSSQALTASFTPNALITASVSSNVLTFTKGNGSTFNLTVNTGSAVVPGGSNTQIQYNSGSKFAGSQYFTYIYQSQSLQQGDLVSAKGSYSHAEGYGTVAQGNNSHAEGLESTANANYSHAEGYGTLAAGVASHAEGRYTAANADYSHAEGFGTAANGAYSHAEGLSTYANGLSSHAEGANTVASGSYSHAEGYNSEADQDYSHAEGHYTRTYNTYLTATGSAVTVYAYTQHAVGTGSVTATTQGTNFSTKLLWGDLDSDQVWLSDVVGVADIDIDGTGIKTVHYITEYDGQGPVGNVITGSKVYDIINPQVGAAWGALPIGLFDYDNNLIEVYDIDLTVIQAALGILVTVPNYGTYPFNLTSVSYASNTSSITFGTEQAINSNAGAPSLTGVVLNNQGHVFDTQIDEFGTFWSDYENLTLLDNTNSITATKYYDFFSQSFQVSGSYVDAFRSGTPIDFNGNFVTTTSSSFSSGVTTVTIGTQQSSDLFYTAPVVKLGFASHTQGAYTKAYGAYQTIVGQYNTDNNYKDLFVVGGGTSDSNRKDVLAVSTTTTTINNLLTITPQHPLPTTLIPTGTFAVSSSIPAKPYFWNGSSWNSLY